MRCDAAHISWQIVRVEVWAEAEGTEQDGWGVFLSLRREDSLSLIHLSPGAIAAEPRLIPESQGGAGDLHLWNRIWQKWWDATYRIRLQKTMASFLGMLAYCWLTHPWGIEGALWRAPHAKRPRLLINMWGNLEVDPLLTHSPGRWCDCNLMRDLDPETPTQAMIHKIYEIINGVSVYIWVICYTAVGNQHQCLLYQEQFLVLGAQYYAE